MRARLRQLLEYLSDSFWLRPSVIVAGGIAAAELLIDLDRTDSVIPEALSHWLYSGGETGARTLLGAVAGSTISVAGTVFSITIATLTLASNQMGPRLLRNFTRDRANQTVLGIYLGTFAYSLMVLRSVRGAEEDAFVPHLAITGAIGLALLCVAMLIFFVHHVASRINSETVIDLVHEDLHRTLIELTTTEPTPPSPGLEYWAGGVPIIEKRSGFVQQLDEDAIADWASEHSAAIRFHARIGTFVFPGAAIASVVPASEDAKDVIESSLVLGHHPTASMDIEFAVTQLVDIAVRALSSGINDPNTAIRVLDQLGAALCVLAGRHLPTGVTMRAGRVVLERDTTTYDGLVDAMLHTIRQNASGSPSVLIRMLEVLGKVAECEQRSDRRETLARHGHLVRSDGLASIANRSDCATLEGRYQRLLSVLGTEAVSA